LIPSQARNDRLFYCHPELDSGSPTSETFTLRNSFNLLIPGQARNDRLFYCHSELDSESHTFKAVLT